MLCGKALVALADPERGAQEGFSGVLLIKLPGEMVPGNPWGAGV